MSTPLIEAIARAMADELESNGAYVKGDLRKCLIDGGLLDMHDIAQAALTAITEAGYICVPRVPTEAMERAASDAMKALGGVVYGEDPCVCYRAMISAAQGDW